MCMYLQIQVRKKLSLSEISHLQKKFICTSGNFARISFLDEICNKYKSQGVKGWMNIFLYSDLNGCITDITLAFPEGLTVTDDDVSLILQLPKRNANYSSR